MSNPSPISNGLSYFLKSGNTFRVTSRDALDLHDNLPAGNYVIKQTQNGELYLGGLFDVL
jgi:hypothetical protein